MKTSFQTAKVQSAQKTPVPPKSLRVLTWVSIGLLSAAVVSAVAAILFMTVIEPRRAVAQVRMKDGHVVKVTTREFQRRLEFERARIVHQKELEAARSNPAFGTTLEIDYRQLSTLAFAGSILDRMTKEILIEEAAQEAGLKASEEEVDALIQLVDTAPSALAPASPSSAANPAVAPKPVMATAPSKVRLKMDPKEIPANYREIIRREILEKKLRADHYRSIPIEEERVQLRLIRFEFEPDARRALATLSNPSSFDDLYKKATAGEIASATGMIHDWSSAAELQRDFNLSFSQAVQPLQKGDYIKEPVAAARGWYLIQAADRGPRTMSEEWRKQRGEDSYRRWLENQQVRITQNPLWMNRVPLHPKATQGGFALDSLPNNPPAGGGAMPGMMKNGMKNHDRDHRSGPGGSSKKDSSGNDFLRGGNRPDQPPGRTERGPKTVGPSPHTMPDVPR